MKKRSVNPNGHLVIGHCIICDCGCFSLYNERYDSEYCADCNKWLVDACTDSACEGFIDMNRPGKPKRG